MLSRPGASRRAPTADPAGGCRAARPPCDRNSRSSIGCCRSHGVSQPFRRAAGRIVTGPFCVPRSSHAAIKRHRKYLANYRFLVGRGARELLRVVGVGEPLVISLGASPSLVPSASPIRYAARGLPQFPTRRADVPSRQASFVRSRSTALASMISLRDHPAGSTKAVLGNFRVATLGGLVQGGV